MQLLHAMYDAFNARDIDAALAGTHTDVDWPNAFEGGRVHGHEAVRAYWTRQWAVIDPWVDIEDLETEGDGRVIATVHLMVRDLVGSVLTDQMVRHVYTIEDGLVRRMDVVEHW